MHGLFPASPPCHRALTGVTSHREVSGVRSRSVSERPSVMTMATLLLEVNLRSRLSLLNCRASPVWVPPAIHFRFLTALQAETSVSLPSHPVDITGTARNTHLADTPTCLQGRAKSCLHGALGR